jgi:hypothetical protein
LRVVGVDARRDSLSGHPAQARVPLRESTPFRGAKGDLTLTPSSCYPRNTQSELAPRNSGEEDHLKNVKPFIETLRVANPVRQSWASSREASLARGAGDRHCEA